MPHKPTRLTLRQLKQRNELATNLYATLGQEQVRFDIPEAPKPRAPRDPSAEPAVPLERDVQAAIIEGLRQHPMVGIVHRMNSGQAVERNADGSNRYIQFSHVYSVRGVRFRATDLDVTLQGPGPWAGKRLVLEVKRSGWKAPRDERERGQEAFIRFVRACGGYGAFVTSWAEVEIELERIRAAG